MGCFHWGLFVLRSGEGGEKAPTQILSSFNFGYHPAFYPCLDTCESCVRKQNVYQICRRGGRPRGRCFRVFRSEILANCREKSLLTVGIPGKVKAAPIPRSHWSYPSDTWHFLSKLPNSGPFKLSLWHAEDKFMSFPSFKWTQGRIGRYKVWNMWNMDVSLITEIYSNFTKKTLILIAGFKNIQH